MSGSGEYPQGTQSVGGHRGQPYRWVVSDYYRSPVLTIERLLDPVMAAAAMTPSSVSVFSHTLPQRGFQLETKE